MRIKKGFLFLLFILIFNTSFSQINTITQLAVPFQLQPINPKNTLIANYSFGNNQAIVCYDVSLGNVGTVTFPQNSILITRNLTVIMTNNTDIAGGVPADPAGLIYIYNTQKQIIYISCNFAF